MFQPVAEQLTFDEFIAWHPDKDHIFELIEGVPWEVNPTGPHEKLSGKLSYRLNSAIEQANLPFFIPKTATLKPLREKAGYKPDIVILDERLIQEEPRWEKESTIISGASAPLVVEIASTNWRDDYGLKLGDYELMGIGEYWIVDYLALGAVRYIGSPKQPTLSLYQLIDGEYQVNRFRGAEQIISSVLPTLQLTVEQMMGFCG